MSSSSRRIYNLFGLAVLIWAGWHYASVWNSHAKNAEYYRLYLAGRLTNVSSGPSRLAMIESKLALDRAGVVATVATGAGLALIGLAWFMPRRST